MNPPAAVRPPVYAPLVEGIYTGNSLNSLTQVACNLGNPLLFNAIAGTTYFIQVVNRAGLGHPTTFSLIPPVDTTPPVLTVPPDITTEATGPIGAVVTYSAIATDDTDPNPTVVCTPPSGSTFPLGMTTVACTATDASSNSASASFHVTVVDTTPPVLTVPSDITANANSPAGAEVVFAATATDIVDGTFAASCTPPSGSTFPIGTMPVACTATDAHGNSASASFTVHVKGADEQLDDLLDLVVTDGLGPGTSLPSKLRAARAALSDGDHLATCRILGAFINEAQAQSGKAVTPEQATELVAAANQIRAVLDC